MNRFTRLAATGISSPRWQQYRGRRHLVVDVVALKGNIVIRGLLSTGDEFIPADVLAAAPAGFAGRPVVNYHPDGIANDPDIYESDVYGIVFNSRFDTRTNSLVMEAWLDEQRVREIGGDAEESFDALVAGEMVEVSVGAWVWLEDRIGTAPNGQRYSQSWVSWVPEHLAVGLQRHGGVGACSIDTGGCGANRRFSAADDNAPLTPAQMRSALEAARAALGKDYAMSNSHACGCQGYCQCENLETYRPVDPWGLQPALCRELGMIPREEWLTRQLADAALKANPNAPPDPWGSAPLLALALGMKPTIR